MAINFWDAQRRAKRKSLLYFAVFVALAVTMAYLIDLAARFLASQGYIPPTRYLGILFLVITFLVTLIYTLIYSSSGGSFVAETLGAKKVSPQSADLKEQQLLNIVHEMALASGLPTPPVYVLEAQEINAFAAGMRPQNAAITVTRGSLHLLNRDELQGVIAHEFGHIANGDMKMNLRLSAMIMGFVIILYLGIRFLESSVFMGRGDSDKRGNPIALIALVFVLAGSVTWFAGAILRSMVSRQREYLADACSVQYTRNPRAIANALRKIAARPIQDMPKRGMAYSHLYFENHSFWSTLFATHPPIEKRIKAIEQGTYSGEPEKDLKS